MLAFFRFLVTVVFCTCLAGGATAQDEEGHVALGMTDYRGWQGLADLPDSPALAGIGVSLDIRRYPDQRVAVTAFLSGEVGLIAISNVDLLLMIGQSEVFPPSVVVLPTDVSQGADMVLMRAGRDVMQMARTGVATPRPSVSSYLLFRATESFLKDLPNRPAIRDRSQPDAVAGFLSGDFDFISVRDPALPRGRNSDDVAVIFDSTELNGEIFNLLVMRRELEDQFPGLTAALQDGWYRGDDPSAGDEAGFRLLRDREAGLRFLLSGKMQSDLLRIKTFVTSITRQTVMNKVLGDFGIRFADGMLIGDPSNVLLEFSLPDGAATPLR